VTTTKWLYAALRESKGDIAAAETFLASQRTVNASKALKIIARTRASEGPNATRWHIGAYGAVYVDDAASNGMAS
jgi:hypothetical protein